MKPYPAYKPTGLAWLPEVPREWEMLRLRQMLKPFSEKGHPTAQLLSVVREKGVIVRDTENDEENHNFIPDDLSGYKFVRKGQFAMNKMKAWQGSYGVSDYEGIVSPAYFVFDLVADVLPRFFHIAIRSCFYVPYFASASDGIRVGQWDLSMPRMKEIPFFIPPPAEQEAIVAYLDEKTAKIDRLIELKEREIKLLNEKKQAVVSKVVTRGLDPNAELVDSGVDWIGKVPRGWRIDALKHSLDILPGYAFPSDDFNAANGIRLLRGVNVAVGGLRWEEVVYWNKEILPVMRPFVLEEGDLIVGLDRPWISDGTRVAFVTKKDLPALLVQRVCRIRKTGSVDLRYVYLWLASVAFERSLTTETTGISVPHISTKQIGDFKIAIPPLSEQREIVTYLDAEGAKTDKAIGAVTRQIGLLKEYRTRLISDAVTGRINLRKAVA